MLTKPEFTQFLDSHLAGLDAASPLVPLDPRMRIFDAYNATPGTTNLSLAFNPNCWLPVQLRTQLKLVCWHDAAPISGAARCVAITPRHVIMNEHVGEPQNQALVWWDTATNSTVVRWGVGVVFNITKSGIIGTNDPSATLAFRMYYLDSDLPRGLVCRMILPSDLGTNPPTNLQGVPVIAINQLNEVVIHNLFRDPVKEWLSLRDPVITDAGIANQRRSKLWRWPSGGDSGTPVFYVLNGALVFAGHIGSSDPAGNVQPSGASALQCYKYIVEACQRLNQQFAPQYNVPSYLPVTKVRAAYTPPRSPGF